MGVFDPGINALSILTRLIPERLVMEDADLGMPSNRQAPLTAELALRTGSGAPIKVSFDFLQTGPQRWDICLAAGEEELVLSEGGARLAIDGVDCALTTEAHHEYRGVYGNFAACVRRRVNDCDLRPLEIVADAFLIGKRRTLAPFTF